MSNRILIIEDDSNISSLLKLNLEELGHQVTIVDNGNKAIIEFSNQNYDLVIVDLMLPGIDGKEIIRQIRTTNIEVPILITTVKSDLMHKVIGFEIGADDYLAKPFEMAELVARAKALLRRRLSSATPSTEEENLGIGNIKIDRYRHKTYLKDKEIDLSPKLYDLLVFLMKRPGKAYTRSELLMHVWEYAHEGYEHTVDTHINRLRAKIEPKPANPTYILTVWGVGYRFVEPHELIQKDK